MVVVVQLMAGTIFSFLFFVVALFRISEAVGPTDLMGPTWKFGVHWSRPLVSDLQL